MLYLSYDGMCDPLGASQVLPYLFGLAKRGHRISLISFEKPERSAEERAAVRAACDDAGIDWHPLPYHKQPPVLSSIYEIRQMSRLAERLHREQDFDLIHCRSYLPALVGLRMKRRDGVKFLFDMRGFWADERIDGRIWNLKNPLFRAVYHYFKRREQEFINEADHIVSLTDAGKAILLQRRNKAASPSITVIPCCTDFDVFPPVTAAARAIARRELGISEDATVAAYLGSFGSWYMIGEMMDFFQVQLERDPSSTFLILSREPRESIIAAAKNGGIPADRLIVRSTSRDEVPTLTAAADYGLFFIKPVFSKKASSPTKMGEFLALELPIVANGDVGDVERIMHETGAGVVVDQFNDAAYGRALDQLAELRPDKAKWRSSARKWFDLNMGVERYDRIYSRLTTAAAAEAQNAA